MTIDLDALEALYRDDNRRPVGYIGQAHVLALIAELRQERERADAAERALRATDDYRVADWQKLELERDEAESALSRAEETIAAALAEEERCTDRRTRMWRILNDYSKQKGAGA